MRDGAGAHGTRFFELVRERHRGHAFGWKNFDWLRSERREHFGARGGHRAGDQPSSARPFVPALRDDGEEERTRPGARALAPNFARSRWRSLAGRQLTGCAILPAVTERSEE